MGIKGIYGEIGNGQRIALAKLAAEHLKSYGRRLRIAVDASIWLFQIQAAQGGSNPEIRSLYFRLVRLLGLCIQPLFVFDGPNKPPYKRNAPTSTKSPVASKKAKRLIELFGFPHVTAPGEAEADCALLQRQGLVDIVLSEDVDTLAFGCTASIRNWSSEGSRGNKAPTHVNLLSADEIKNGPSGLDREGMVLVAMMSGGDYLPAGIPRCGIKLACEAARAKFGHDLCRIALDDDDGFEAWKERLRHELATNESRFFKTRHKSLKIPESFPDKTVLGYHTSPVVSSKEAIDILRARLKKEIPIDLKGLRDFVDEEFGWKNMSGAKRFLRQLAPSVLTHKLRLQTELCKGYSSLEEQTEHEERLILSILDRRANFQTDGTPELKVSYIPALVVGLDLDMEHLDEGSDAESTSAEETETTTQRIEGIAVPGIKGSKLSEWDPWSPDQAWVLELPVSLGAPLSLERWNAAMQMSKLSAARKVRGKEAKLYGGMRKGAIESYLTITKPHTLSAKERSVLGHKSMSIAGSGSLDSHISSNSSSDLVEESPEPRSGLGITTPLRTTKGAVRIHNMERKLNSPDAASSNSHNLNSSATALRTRILENALSAATRDRGIASGNPRVVIRKSVEGSWKHLGSHDEQITPERIFSNVDILDMTRD